MTSEIHSFNSLEVSYVFVKFLLVFWPSNLYPLFILVGFNHLNMVLNCPFLALFFGAFRRFSLRKLYRVNLHYIGILLNLVLTSINTLLYRESLLSSRSSLLYRALCRRKRLFNIMLILGLSLLRVVGEYKIFTEFVH